MDHANRSQRRNTLLTSASITVVFTGVLLTWSLGWLDKFDDALWDGFISFQQKSEPSDIAIIEIDSRSINQMERWPWSRKHYADVIRKLADANLASLFIDVDFSARSPDQEADQSLVDAIALISDTTPVRLPAFIQPVSTGSRQLDFRQPLPELLPFVEQVTVNMQPGKDGLVRSVNEGFSWQGENIRSAWNAIADTPIQRTRIDYTIALNSFEYYSFVDVLQGRVPVENFQGKNVLIGATAIELGDLIPAPIYHMLPGVVLHGISAQTLDNGGLEKMSPPSSLVCLIVVAMAAAVVFYFSHWFVGLVLTGGFSLVLAPVYYFYYHQFNLIIPYLPPVMMVMWLYFASLISRIDALAIQKFWLQLNLINRGKFLDSVFAASNECILCVDGDNIITSANARCEAIMGCGSDDLIGKIVTDIMPVDVSRYSEKASAPFEVELLTQKGDYLPVEICVSPLTVGNENNFTLAIRDISDRVEREKELSYALTHDKQTGVLNRATLFRQADQVLTRDCDHYFFKIDIDYFNEINELYGHSVGDKVLSRVASYLVRAFPERALIGRLGKSEFGALVSCEQHHDLDAFAQEISRELNCTLDLGLDSIEMFCHVGIAKSAGSGGTTEILVRQGNQALQAAKVKGLEYEKNEGDEIKSPLQSLQMIGAIRHYLRNNAFELFFQPKVSLENEKVLGCEVLLRAPKTEQWDVPIFRLIEVAESTRLIAPLTFWVVDNVLDMEEKWCAEKLPKKVAINLSTGLLANDRFIDQLIGRIQRKNPYFDIEFEITETSLIHSWNDSLNNIRKLVAAGVTLSIDDFGTGYSSLSYLRDLNAKVLKIDKVFIKDIHWKADQQSIVRSTIKMAHELGMSVVAEGIEQEFEKEFLKECGCDQGQGFLFGRPMSYLDYCDWFNVQSSPNVINLSKAD